MQALLGVGDLLGLLELGLENLEAVVEERHFLVVVVGLLPDDGLEILVLLLNLGEDLKFLLELGVGGVDEGELGVWGVFDGLVEVAEELPLLVNFTEQLEVLCVLGVEVFVLLVDDDFEDFAAFLLLGNVAFQLLDVGG